ncbi:EAL domain-containing protein [Halioglobus maricola]|uniref:EAL domain-containing protein n=1 Tax=Halioglobus maricola TaxID=2601894 RepID=A0A5P9NEY1_9GAMM|nr:EAL domain-containing protein [Halioglobus maricola]QFU74300.1 EAL domain-containing protein [Halioglobus maricola]
MIGSWSAQSIRKKLILVMLLVSGSVLVLASLAFSISDWMTSRGHLNEKLRAEAGIISRNVVSSLAFSDPASAGETLASLGIERELVFAVLYDEQGEVFASFANADAEYMVPSARDLQIPDGVLSVTEPVLLDGRTIGTVVLVSEMKIWQQQQLRKGLLALLVYAVGLLVSLLLASRLHRLVTRPIMELAATAKKITATRDYSLRAAQQSEDETGSLVSSFNEMLGEIQARDNQLLEIREKLEQKVEERTAELRRLADEYAHQASHDALTGLANRITFEDRLQMALLNAERYKHSAAVLFLDLDRFKTINDTLGHSIGDQLLRRVGENLAECIRESDTLARLGGDEFALLLPQAEPDSLSDVAEKVIAAVNTPVVIDGHGLQVNTSVGISQFPEDGCTTGEIIKNADTAMYASKALGGNRFAFYSSAMNQRAERRLALEVKLRQAWSDGRFHVHYQPKFDVASLEMVGLEALVRLHDEEEGDIPASEFVPLAEEVGMIKKIDLWVIEKACDEVLSCGGGEVPIKQLSVNISPGHFVGDELYDELASILERTGFPGDYLELEITESVIGTQSTDIHQQLQRIRSLGIEIAIDDFGKDYSSLSRLKQLPLNTLKIDRSFISDVCETQDNATIVSTIILMAHNLNLKVVAEGVETPSQYAFIKQHNCHSFQGYLYAKPMAIEGIVALVKKAGLAS